MIYRTGDTHIPNPLLIDLPPHGDNPLDQTPFGTVPSLSDTGVLLNGLEAPPVAKKMIMMKRNPNRENDPKKENSKKEKQSAEDRERAYAEARARIFGAEAEAAAATAAAASTSSSTASLLGNVSPSSTTNIPIKKSNSDNKLEKAVRTSTPRATSASPPPTVVTTNSAQTSNNNIISNSNSNSSSSTNNNNATTRKKVVNSTKKGLNGTEGSASTSEKKAASPSPPLHDNVTQTASTTTPSYENTVTVVNTKKKTVDPTAWKERKFTERDFVAERSDPDFSRRNTATTSNLNNRGVQHGQFVQPVQFRPEDIASGMSGYQQGVQGQVQNLGSMIPGNVPYQGYPISDPYQSAMYGQNAGMIPYLQNGHPYVQTPFMQMNHINPTSPTQQQWQQGHTPGMMMSQNQGI